MNHGDVRRLGGVWPAVLLTGALSGGILAYLCAPGLAGTADSATFQAAPHAFGVAHQPGYPTYTMLGGVWSRLLGLGGVEPARAMNLFTALMGGGVAAMLCRLSLRLGAAPWLGMAIGIYFSQRPLFVEQCVIAEVYTLHLFLCAGLLDALVRWADRRADRDLLIACAWLAAGVGHHTTIVLMAVPMAMFVWLLRRDVSNMPALLLRAGLVLACGFLPYIYILVRSGQAMHPGMVATDLPTLFSQMLGGKMRQFVLGDSPWNGDSIRLFGLLWVWLRQGGPALVLAALGWLTLARQRPPLAMLLGMVVLFHAAWAFVYRVPDADVYFLPGIMASLAPLALLSQWTAFRVRARVGLAVLMLFLLLVGARHWPAQGQRHNVDAAIYTRAMVEQLPDEAILLLPNFVFHQYFVYEHISGNAVGRPWHICGEVSPPDIARYLAGEGPVHPRLPTPPGLPVVMPDQPAAVNPYGPDGWAPVDVVARLHEDFATRRVGLGVQAFGREVCYYVVESATP